MIIEIKGDLIAMAEAGEVDGLAHGCNCFHAMGSGIAGQLARKYPDVPAADVADTVCGDFSKLGTFTVADVDSKGSVFEVFNCYTQKAPSYNGEDVFDYDTFPALLQKLHGHINTYYSGFVTIGERYILGFPRIGAGLAGGDWPRIRSMIEAEFTDSPLVDVVLIEYQP